MNDIEYIDMDYIHAKKELGQYPAILTEQACDIWDKTPKNYLGIYDIKHQKIIFDLAGPSEKSRVGKIAPSG